ncbi:MAG: nucleoid-associated protein [uncultured Clostridium sp.]
MIYESNKTKKKNGFEYKEQRMMIDTGDRVNDINIQDAVIHVLDVNVDEPILNEYALELTEDTYKFLYKHIDKIFKSDDLVPAKFCDERSPIKDIVEDYFKDGINGNLIEISKDLANTLFYIMKGDSNILSCDLIVTTILTDQGPMLGILNLDYVNSFAHQVEFIDDKVGVGLIKHSSTLPGGGQKIKKAAFIKPIKEGQKFDLWVMDNDKPRKIDDGYSENYFSNIFLGCNKVSDSRTETKTFINAVERWTRSNITENAEEAEKIRTSVKEQLQKENNININELADELFRDEPNKKKDFERFIKGNGIDEEIKVDKQFVEKKLKRTRLKIDNDIDLYITQEAYKDKSKFEIQRNGDGSINMIIKHVINYIEK